MFAARPHEPYELYPIQMTSPGRRSQKSLLAPVALLLWSTVLALCSAGVSVSAKPIQAEQGLFAKRDAGPPQSQSLSPKIWIPIVIAIIVLFCIGIMTWTKTSWRKTLQLFSFAGSATLPGAGTTGARELTAEQLAGTINNGTTPANTNGNGNAARTTRRARRPRRTPSQMSVTSLPEYNKEPGEEELVIFRGRDMEDVTTMPAAIAMTSIDEDRSSESLHSRDNSQVSRYSPMPTSPNNMPLLRDEDANAAYGDLSLQSLSPEGEDMPRLRRHSDVGSHETSSLMRAEDSNAHLPDTTELAQDPRGDAPPYFEVVDLTEVHHNRTNSDGSIGPLEPQSQSQSHLIATSDPATNTNATTTTTTDTTTNANTNTNRRSGFRTLLNRMSMVGHTRNESTSSNFSSNLPVSHPRPSTSTSHHSRPSTSMSMFRTLSRQRSTHTLNSASASNSRLTSPSLISLHSISAPLTHTVTRTEFTYPKSGPTAEQLKVISSRESFARFGMPYGADAIAFAASASGLNLSGIPDEPPPGFEEGPSQTQRAPTPGPSRLRTESRAGASTPPPVTGTQENAQPQSAPSTMPPQAPSSAPAAIPLTTDAPPPGLPLTHTPAAETPYSSTSKNHNGSTPSPAPTAEPKPQPETAQITASLAPAQTPSISSTSTSTSNSNPNHPPSISEFGKLSIPPPSSYTSASASASSTRSESRASVFSYQSYATAAESLTPSSAQAFFSDADGDADSDVGAGDMTSEPSTPKMGGQHVLEMTDATVVLGDREGDDDRRRTILATAGVAGTSSLAR